MLKFSRQSFSWKKTVFVVGLPRSGKSTVLNLLLSCDDVEGVDEPYELLVLAQKGASYLGDDVRLAEYLDSYWACMENYFSELVLGRRYNFRRTDKSFIFNVKTKDRIRRNIERKRRADVIKYASECDSVFALAFNDVERGLSFLASGVPSPIFIYVRRSLPAVAAEIADKEWLSDPELAGLANMGQAFTKTVERQGRIIYLPYQIPEALVDLFLSHSNPERALLYSYFQETEIRRALGKVSVPTLHVDFDRFLSDPKTAFDEVLTFTNLRKTPKSEALIQAINDTSIGTQSAAIESTRKPGMGRDVAE